jgi:hypothetical protein
MLSLKSGAPEIDIHRFQTNGKFNTLKTAQNTWGVLKRKLVNTTATMNNTNAAENGEQPTTPSSGSTAARESKTTPRKTPTASRKRTSVVGKNIKTEEDGSAEIFIADDEVAANGYAYGDAEDEGEEEQASPKKKSKVVTTPRKTKPAPAAAGNTPKSGGSKTKKGKGKKAGDADEVIPPTENGDELEGQGQGHEGGEVGVKEEVLDDF